MNLNIFVLGGFAKLIKARKQYTCFKCNKKIPKGVRYFFYSSANYIPYYNNDIRKCDRIYSIEKYHVKCNTKQHYHILRSKKRIDNCPDKKFKHIWQGGWISGSNPYPDGGDVQLECHNCNLYCIQK